MNVKKDELINDIKNNSKELLIKKAEILKIAIKKIEERNNFLTQLPEFQTTNLLPENQIKLPNKDIMNNYFKARSRLLFIEKRFERLSFGKNELDNRIESAKQLLKEEKEKQMAKFVSYLSPTAASFLKNTIFSQNRNNSINTSQSLEIINLKTQIEAIKSLKSGIKPKPRGFLSVDFDSLIQEENDNLKNILLIKDQHMDRFVNYLKNFFGLSDSFNSTIISHSNFAQSFTNFHNSYLNASNSIENQKFCTVLHYLQKEINQQTQQHKNFIIDSINKEKKLIFELLEKIGIDDDLSSQLKEEIEIQLLYLGHLTAIAEKTLCKLSKRIEPIDPLDSLELEIAENNQN